jgi:hypothetical protein
MPWTAKQKRAMGAEIARREKGLKPRLFKGMSLAKLKREIKMPTKKK